MGEGSIITILDGSFALGKEMATNLSDEAWEAALRDTYRDPSGPVDLGITVHLFRNVDWLTLIDAGAGSAFGPASGKLSGALQATGIEPADVREILLTHMHPDHIDGLLSDGSAAFADASIRVSATELGFWTDEASASRAPKEAQDFFSLARNVAGTYGDRISTFEGEADLGRGISSVSLPGHSLGYSRFRIDAGVTAS